MALIFGTTGDDTITGTDENDRFIMSTGNDVLIGGLGIDHYTNDHPNEGSYLALQDLVIDMAQGTATADGFSQTFQDFENASYDAHANSKATYTTILGDEQGNSLWLNGYSGLLDGGAGNDRLTFNWISDGTMRGGDGDDRFTVDSSRGGTVEGGAGIDTLVLYAGVEDVTVSRNAQNKVVLDWYNSGGGNVTLIDQFEVFRLSGGNSAHELYTLNDEDTFVPIVNPITGTESGEVITGTDQIEQISGLGGNDWILASKGYDQIDGGAGIDMLSFVDLSSVKVNLAWRSANIDFQTGGANPISQLVLGIENLTGSSGDDFLSGNEESNYIRGLGGRDQMFISGGSDLLNGGAGTDILQSHEFPSDTAMNVSLLRGRIWGGEGAGTRLLNIEHVLGTAVDDTLTGDHAANKLDGQQGDDTLMGNGGNDLIYGDAGTDTAVFGFAQDQYEITQTGGVTEVAYTGAGDGDGTDRLLSIEILRFADGDVIL